MPDIPAIFVLCPHCTSVFSITSQQLNAAMGAVRCGQCKKIFNAKFNLLSKEEVDAYLASSEAYYAQQQEAEANYLSSASEKVDYSHSAYSNQHYSDQRYPETAYQDHKYSEAEFDDPDYPEQDFLDEGFVDENHLTQGYSAEPPLREDLRAAFNPGFNPEFASSAYSATEKEAFNSSLEDLAPTAIEGDPLDETFNSHTPGEFDFSQLDEVPLEVLDLRQLDLTPEEEAKFHEVEINLDEWLAAADIEAKDLAEKKSSKFQMQTRSPMPKQEPRLDLDLSDLEPQVLDNSQEDLLSEKIITSLENDFPATPANEKIIEPDNIPLLNENKDTAMDKKTNFKLIIIVTLLLALAAGIGGALWFINSANQGDFKISKVSVNPTASQLQLRVEFKVTNTTSETKILPTFEVHLLNLSDKTITKHLATASSLGAPNSGLQAGKSYDLSLTVERPNMLVKSAKVEVYQRN